MNKILLTCLICLFPALLLAQNSQQQNEFKIYRDSLKHLGNKIINSPEELERKNANYNFIRTLISTLKMPGSFGFNFDSVKTITITNAPDNRFRIFTWHVMNDDGSYRFYGSIQMNTGNGPLVLHPLGDFTPLIHSPEDTVTDNTKWYGAQYYQIIPVAAATPYYILLGWKGNTVKSTKKLIEVLSFKNGKPVFGLPVFEEKSKIRDRIVFEYSRQASMLLKYLPDHKWIVFDHLAPPDKKMKDQFDTYGPDLTYDGYRLSNGKWVYVENLDMRNMPDVSDDLFGDPRKQAPQPEPAAKHH